MADEPTTPINNVSAVSASIVSAAKRASSSMDDGNAGHEGEADPLVRRYFFAATQVSARMEYAPASIPEPNCDTVKRMYAVGSDELAGVADRPDGEYYIKDSFEARLCITAKTVNGLQYFKPKHGTFYTAAPSFAFLAEGLLRAGHPHSSVEEITACAAVVYATFPSQGGGLPRAGPRPGGKRKGAAGKSKQEVSVEQGEDEGDNDGEHASGKAAKKQRKPRARAQKKLDLDGPPAAELSLPDIEDHGDPFLQAVGGVSPLIFDTDHITGPPGRFGDDDVGDFGDEPAYTAPPEAARKRKRPDTKPPSSDRAGDEDEDEQEYSQAPASAAPLKKPKSDAPPAKAAPAKDGKSTGKRLESDAPLRAADTISLPREAGSAKSGLKGVAGGSVGSSGASSAQAAAKRPQSSVNRQSSVDSEFDDGESSPKKVAPKSSTEHKKQQKQSKADQAASAWM
jgi:hypothetical protein